MRYFLMLLCMAGILSSCSTKFDINAPYQDVTIVYGLLNPAEGTQYVRIEKGYLDASRSALEIAAIPDSIYYGNILTVMLVPTPGTPSDTIRLTRTVNNVPKDSGTFANNPNILYETNHAIDPAKNYSLIIKNSSSGKVITSNASIVKDFRVIAPSVALSPDIDMAAFNLDGTPKVYGVSFVSAVNAKIYSLTVRFHYVEWDISNPAVVDTQYVDWLIFNDKTSIDSIGGENLQYNIVGRQFYNFLATAIKKDNTKNRNIIARPLEFMFTAGGSALYDFVRVSQAQNGITQLQAQTKYTNIDGGLGIFSSRYFKSVPNVGLNIAAKDTLACGYITKDLNFVIPHTSCHP